MRLLISHEEIVNMSKSIGEQISRDYQEKEPVIVYRLILGQTMDETALKAIEGKISTQEAMLSALKEKARKYIEPT